MIDIKSIYKKEFDLYDDVFNISYGNDGMPRSRVVPTEGMVKEILKRLTEIWDDVSGYNEILRKESFDKLSCLLLASKAPHVTMPAISRNALFSERILLPHPMLYLQTLQGEQGPFYMPDVWAEEFMKSALYICSLRDWIADDFIRLIPPPCLYSNNVKQRVNSTIITASHKKTGLEQHVKNLSNNTQVIVELLTEMDNDMRQFLLNKMRNEDKKKYDEVVVELEKEPEYPEWLKINARKNSRGEIWHTGVGLHNIEIKYLANNWNLYLNPLSMIQKSVLIEELNTKHNVVSNFVESIDIQFPKNAPLKYIYHCRKSGLLSNFRNYLLKQYEQIRDIDSEEQANLIQENFNNTINSQVEALNIELKDFNRELIKDIIDVGASNIGLGFDLATNNFSVSSIMNLAGGALSRSVPKIKRYKELKKNPLIVLHNMRR